MKKNISLIYLFFISLFLFSVLVVSKQQTNPNIIYGDWVGQIGNNNVSISFNKDKTCEIVIHNFINRDSVKIKGNFAIDFSKTPMPLSIKNISNLDFPLHTIIEFSNKNELRIGNFAKRWRLRPIAFDYNKDLKLKKGTQNG